VNNKEKSLKKSKAKKRANERLFMPGENLLGARKGASMKPSLVFFESAVILGL
jgi:hypothetical protein